MRNVVFRSDAFHKAFPDLAPGVCCRRRSPAPQVGLEPTTLRLTASRDAANPTTLRRRWQPTGTLRYWR